MNQRFAPATCDLAWPLYARARHNANNRVREEEGEILYCAFGCSTGTCRYPTSSSCRILVATSSSGPRSFETINTTTSFSERSFNSVQRSSKYTQTEYRWPFMSKFFSCRETGPTGTCELPRCNSNDMARRLVCESSWFTASRVSEISF